MLIPFISLGCELKRFYTGDCWNENYNNITFRGKHFCGFSSASGN